MSKAPSKEAQMSTFITLIPKKRRVEDLKDFKSISLVGGLYKILAKVMTIKIKKVVRKVVYELFERLCLSLNMLL